MRGDTAPGDVPSDAAETAPRDVPSNAADTAAEQDDTDDDSDSDALTLSISPKRALVSLAFLGALLARRRREDAV